jgi:cytochrome c oxidase subunit 2
VPVALELVSEDRVHGFSAPELGLRAEVRPERPTEIAFVPTKPGRFRFHCDVFCGEGHEEMTGEILVGSSPRMPGGPPSR